MMVAMASATLDWLGRGIKSHLLVWLHLELLFPLEQSCSVSVITGWIYLRNCHFALLSESISSNSFVLGHHV